MSVKHKASLLLFLALLLAGCTPAPQAPQVQDIQVIQATERSISAQGMGEVRIRPDAVRFTIITETYGSEPTAALEDNEKEIRDALALLKKYEIADADVEPGQSRQEKTLYKDPYRHRVQRNIKVVLRDLTKFETLFTEILQAKIYQISEVRFLISDMTIYKEQALDLAVSDARNKAEIMAAEIGREIGEVLTVYEGNGYGYETGIDWYSPNLEVQIPDTISQSFNELEIQVRVKLVFQLK